MSHQEGQSPGTGLRDVFDLLLKAPQERLHSLTIQLGVSPEEKIIHALCQVVLQRPERAFDILQTLEDHSLACHLAEQWQTATFELKSFGDHCSRFQALTGETLAALARIFRVLTQQQLCDQRQRNLAYKRAISSDCQKTSTYDELRYEQFREEAKDVCGPQVSEWICSSTDSGSFSSSHTPLDGASITLKICESPAQALSTLQTISSVPSFPTHLEMSIPSTIPFQEDRLASQASGNHKLSLPSLIKDMREAENAPELSQSCEHEPQLTCVSSVSSKERLMDETSAAISCKSNPIPQKTNIQPKCAQPAVTDTLLPKMPTSRDTHEAPEEEEEDIFYAFVILHAQEDFDMAETMKEKVENVVGCDGATFSGDFAIPGKSTLKCVEDAINNSAFTFLLLTCNFNTRMLDMKTNTALMNAINNEHKYNTVVPLLPRENCMPRPRIPLVLQTIVPLDENRSFERKIQKFLSKAKIEKQRIKWTEEQMAKKQEKLSAVSQHAQTENLRLSIEQKLLVTDRWNLPPKICIQNAKYIMIGNDSQMTVGVGDSVSGVNADNGDTVCTKEEQHI
ncbi:unnamed protein product [Ophioblennius macclurei]